MKTLEDERQGVITAYKLLVSGSGNETNKLPVLEILRNLFVLAYIACPRYPYI